jgi:hypothetical protein
MTTIYRELHNLIAPYVSDEQRASFEQGLTDLIQHVNDRYAEGAAYVTSQQ